MTSRPGAGTGGLPPPAGPPLRAGRWRVERWSGPVRPFHERPWPEPSVPTVWLLRPAQPAVVLGSTQPLEAVDRVRAAALGIDVVRRRSGGGAVLLVPDEVVWVDVLVPAGDRRWDRDVGLAFGWLGQAWAGALADLGVEAHPHQGAPVHTPWSRTVCFAGIGPGEVTAGGRKVVGISQRRTRAGALFQCAALLRWDPRQVLDLLVLEGPERERILPELQELAGGLDVEPARLEGALVGRLAGL